MMMTNTMTKKVEVKAKTKTKKRYMGDRFITSREGKNGLEKDYETKRQIIEQQTEYGGYMDKDGEYFNVENNQENTFGRANGAIIPNNHAN